jgi:kelch-like protein 18
VAGGTWDAAPPANVPPTFNPFLWRLNTATNTWESLGEVPVPVAGGALAADDDTLYLVGGWDGVAMRDEIWSYTPAAAGAPAGTWTLVGRMAAPRAFLGAVVVNGQLYVVGGFDGQRELARVDVLDLATGRWRTLPPMAVARSGLSLVYDGIAIVALGGGWLDTVTTHERFDPSIEVWSNFPSPLSGSWRHLSAASVDGRLFLMGGWSGGYLDANAQYQSTFRALLPVITGP